MKKKIILTGTLIFLIVSSINAQNLRPFQLNEAIEQVRPLKNRGASSEIAKDNVLRNHRADAVDVVIILAEVNYSDHEIVNAISGMLSNHLLQMSTALQKAGWNAHRSASALKSWASIEKGANIGNAMLQSGYPPTEMADVTSVLFMANPAEATEWMREIGWSPEMTANQLRVQFNLGSVQVVQLMRAARWSREETAAGIISQWTMTPDEWMQIFLEAEGSFTFDNWRRALGFNGQPLLMPRLIRYEIDEFRLNQRGNRLNDGIINRAWVRGPESTDGEVRLYGEHLIRPGVKFFLGGFEAEIKHTEMQGGTDLVTLFFPQTTNEPEQLSILPIFERRFYLTGKMPLHGYGMLSASELQEFLGETRIILGDPAGFGRVQISQISETFDLDAFDVAGTKIEITGIESAPFQFSFVEVPNPGWPFGLVLEASLETKGGEAFRGEFIESVPYWTCSGYEVPESECRNNDLFCFLNYLGLTLESFTVYCANPDNWERHNLIKGPATPFSGEIQNASVKITFGLDISQQREIEFTGAISRFNGNVILHNTPSEITGGMVKDWLESQISKNLGDALQNSSFLTSFQERFNQLSTSFNPGMRGRLHNIQMDRFGNLRLEIGRFE